MKISRFPSSCTFFSSLDGNLSFFFLSFLFSNVRKTRLTKCSFLVLMTFKLGSFSERLSLVRFGDSPSEAAIITAWPPAPPPPTSRTAFSITLTYIFMPVLRSQPCSGRPFPVIYYLSTYPCPSRENQFVREIYGPHFDLREELPSSGNSL